MSDEVRKGLRIDPSQITLKFGETKTLTARFDEIGPRTKVPFEYVWKVKGPQSGVDKIYDWIAATGNSVELDTSEFTPADAGDYHVKVACNLNLGSWQECTKRTKEIVQSHLIKQERIASALPDEEFLQQFFDGMDATIFDAESIVTVETVQEENHTGAVEPLEDMRDAIDTIVRSGLTVKAERPKRGTSGDIDSLWVSIRQCIEGRNFKAYNEFISDILCRPDGVVASGYEELIDKKNHPCYYTHGVHGYELLKAATEVFLLCHSCCGDLSRSLDLANINEVDESNRFEYNTTVEEIRAGIGNYLTSRNSRQILPYIDIILDRLGNLPLGNTDFPFCQDSLRLNPCLFELIWSYWHEEGMLAQTINSIAMRFQNRQVKTGENDPLASFELNPLRPISNLLWGYIQDTDRRLTVKRRAYEYIHEYDLRLLGKAVGDLHPADPRSSFLQAFHNLLNECNNFYKDDANAWIVPDTFPLLEALRAVHLKIAEGAHNQWGDLPSTARMEMLMEQWLLSQPPMREFLQSRAMVPYAEPWMGQVDSMKRLMGWPEASVSHFHNLAVFGELILLSIRFGDWTQQHAVQARNWALYWREEIQGYIEAYRAVTGVDLRGKVTARDRIDSTMPSTHLKKRMARQLRQRKNVGQ